VSKAALPEICSAILPPQPLTAHPVAELTEVEPMEQAEHKPHTRSRNPKGTGPVVAAPVEPPVDRVLDAANQRLEGGRGGQGGGGHRQVAPVASRLAAGTISR
jgi:hypothetical protein